MKIKLAIATFVVLLSSSIFTCAEDGLNTDNIVAKMQLELNLTQAQADSIRPIIEKYALKRQELRQDLKAHMVTDGSVILAKMENLREEENQELSKILTSQQLSKWNNKQKRNNLLNRDRVIDNDWAPKEGQLGMGMSF